METNTKALDAATLALVERLEQDKNRFARANKEKYNFYYGRIRPDDLGISTPESLRYIDESLGWATTAVDVVAERLDFQGCYSATNDALAVRLNTIYRQNELSAIQRSVLKDALITGTSYISVLPGDVSKDESPILIRSESPNTMVGDFNERTLRLDNALKIIRKDDMLIGTLWLPNETIHLAKEVDGSNSWREVGERNVHNLGHVTIVRVRNNYDNEFPNGRTEITRPIRTNLMAALRTLVAVETAREFFAQPLRAITGANAEDFIDPATGEQITGMDMIASGIIGLPFNTQDEVVPNIIQLPASNPQNIMALVNDYAVTVAHEIGVSPSTFSFDTTNPASAEALDLADKKIIKKAEERQHELARAWKQALSFALLITDGEIPDDWNDIEPVFRPVETVSRAQEADAMLKLAQMGLFDKPLPELVYRKLGLKDVEIQQLRQWFKTQQGNQLIESLLQNNGDTTKPAGE